MKPRRRKLAPRKTVADLLIAQATELRRMASAWAASGVPPTVSIAGCECSINVLAMLDLVDDAEAMEADAAKLRTLYR